MSLFIIKAFWVRTQLNQRKDTRFAYILLVCVYVHVKIVGRTKFYECIFLHAFNIFFRCLCLCVCIYTYVYIYMQSGLGSHIHMFGKTIDFHC